MRDHCDAGEDRNGNKAIDKHEQRPDRSSGETRAETGKTEPGGKTVRNGWFQQGQRAAMWRLFIRHKLHSQTRRKGAWVFAGDLRFEIARGGVKNFV